MAEAYKRSAYIQVNLDALTHNVNIIRSRCPDPDKTGLIAVVKAGAYGHGSVVVSRHLKNIGVERLAVATVQEGTHLRKHGIEGPIHVFGNLQAWEMKACLGQRLIPTICSEEAILGMADALRDWNTRSKCTAQISDDVPAGSVNIEIDTGLSRNGCQPEELHSLYKICEDQGVHIDGMYTHFIQSWRDANTSKMQLDMFTTAIDPYRNKGIRFHASNSGAILKDYGLDLDFIRPGGILYGHPPGTEVEDYIFYQLKPALRVIGHPTLVKLLPPGRKVGYGGLYTTRRNEWIATIPFGYVDGYWMHMNKKGVVIRNKTGECCPMVGKVSMDAITVKVPEAVDNTESFTIISDHCDSQVSLSRIAANIGTSWLEVATGMSVRMPKVYTKGISKLIVDTTLPEIY